MSASRQQVEIQKKDDNAEDPERSSSHSAGNTPEPEVSSCHELQNVNSASECLDSGPQEPNRKLLSNCTSKTGNPPVQHFKNVVAIVDPPRGGLHPTVSNTKLPHLMVLTSFKIHEVLVIFYSMAYFLFIFW